MNGNLSGKHLVIEDTDCPIRSAAGSPHRSAIVSTSDVSECN